MGSTPFMTQETYRGEFIKRSSATDKLFNPANVRWEGSPR